MSVAERLDGIRSSIKNWTLAEDSALCGVLETLCRDLQTRSEETEKRMVTLCRRVNSVNTQIENLANSIDITAGQKFIEQRIAEETPAPPTDPSSVIRPKSKAERQAETIESIRLAIVDGLSFLDRDFKRIDVSPSDLDEDDDPTFRPEPVYEPIDPYFRFHPPLIGSANFVAGTSRSPAFHGEAERDESASRRVPQDVVVVAIRPPSPKPPMLRAEPPPQPPHSSSTIPRPPPPPPAPPLQAPITVPTIVPQAQSRPSPSGTPSSTSSHSTQHTSSNTKKSRSPAPRSLFDDESSEEEYESLFTPNIPKPKPTVAPSAAPRVSTLPRKPPSIDSDSDGSSVSRSTKAPSTSVEARTTVPARVEAKPTVQKEQPAPSRQPAPAARKPVPRAPVKSIFDSDDSDSDLFSSVSLPKKQPPMGQRATAPTPRSSEPAKPRNPQQAPERARTSTSSTTQPSQAQPAQPPVPQIVEPDGTFMEVTLPNHASSNKFANLRRDIINPPKDLRNAESPTPQPPPLKKVTPPAKRAPPKKAQKGLFDSDSDYEDLFKPSSKQKTSASTTPASEDKKPKPDIQVPPTAEPKVQVPPPVQQTSPRPPSSQPEELVENDPLLSSEPVEEKGLLPKEKQPEVVKEQVTPEVAEQQDPESEMKGKLADSAFAKNLNAMLGAGPRPPGGVRLPGATSPLREEASTSNTATSPTAPPTEKPATVSAKPAERPASSSSSSRTSHRAPLPKRRPPTKRTHAGNSDESNSGASSSTSANVASTDGQEATRVKASRVEPLAKPAEKTENPVEKAEKIEHSVEKSETQEKPVEQLTKATAALTVSTSTISTSQTKSGVEQPKKPKEEKITTKAATSKEAPQKKSLFDSESDEDDLFAKKVDVKPKAPTPKTTGTLASTTSTAAKTKTSIFDDSDDDLDLFRKK